MDETTETKKQRKRKPSWICFELRNVTTKDAYVGVVETHNLFNYVSHLLRELPGFDLATTNTRFFGARTKRKEEAIAAKAQRLIELRAQARSRGNFVVLNTASRDGHSGKVPRHEQKRVLGQLIERELDQ